MQNVRRRDSAPERICVSGGDTQVVVGDISGSWLARHIVSEEVASELTAQ